MSLAVVIPAFNESAHITRVITGIASSIKTIIVVDDGSTDDTAKIVAAIPDSRVHIIQHNKKKGVGAAMKTGYLHALQDTDVSVVVKIDADGQMNPERIHELVSPIVDQNADYVKANRFYSREGLMEMPMLRLVGNALFSFVSKAACGYWHLMDPTNGYTAIRRSMLECIPLHKIDDGFFFESDMLFRLYLAHARVREVPVAAIYRDEKSHLQLSDGLFNLPIGYVRIFLQRIFYCYFVFNFTVASLQLLFGTLFLTFGFCFGAIHWISSYTSGQVASTGTVMLAALPFILGFQMLLYFISYDVENVPGRRS